MSNLSTFAVLKREVSGKGAARKLRAAGNVPAVFYGTGKENIPLSVNEKTFRKHYESVGKTGVFKLEIDSNGEKKEFNALVWKVVYHPYKKQITHIDFFGVDWVYVPSVGGSMPRPGVKPLLEDVNDWPEKIVFPAAMLPQTDNIIHFVVFHGDPLKYCIYFFLFTQGRSLLLYVRSDNIR